MKLSPFQFLAASSLLLVSTVAFASTRPHYGGAMRIQLRDAVTSLDPAQRDSSSSSRDALLGLIFDRLTQLDDAGNPQPQLAIAWHSDPQQRMWQFQLRPNIKFHDGTPLTPEVVVSSLRSAATAGASTLAWRLSVRTPDTVVIESDTPVPAMPALLSAVRYSIVNYAPASDSSTANSISGTGPFQVGDWQPGQHLGLTANEDYWAGRPYVDSLDIQLGSVQRDQLVDLGLDRQDIVELNINQGRRLTQASQRVSFTQPQVLVAISFFRATLAAADTSSPKSATSDQRLREALALSLDREAMNNVLLQKQGAPAYSLLPQWLSGDAFLFSAVPDTARARKLRAEFGGTPVLALAYDSADPIMKSIAERIAVNARDAGITMQVFGEKNLPDRNSTRPSSADMVLAKQNVASSNSAMALTEVARAFQLDAKAATKAATPEDQFKAERGLLQDFRLTPVVFVPQAYWLSSRVRNWHSWPDGKLHLEQVWVDAER